jgi:hypothetical protein
MGADDGDEFHGWIRFKPRLSIRDFGGSSLTESM